MNPNFSLLCGLIDADIDSLDHDVRLNNIGGSEISSVWGTEDAFFTPLDIWLHKKTGQEPALSNERMRWGRLHELTVGSYINRYLEEKVGYLTKISEYFPSLTTNANEVRPVSSVSSEVPSALTMPRCIMPSCQ